MRRYAAIDIGSNAIRMLFEEVYDRPEGVGFKKLTLVRLPVRLGEDAFVHGAISDKKTSAWNLMSEILLPCRMISRNMIQFHLRQRVRSTIKVNERIINLV